MNSYRIASFVALAACAVSLTACGSDSDSPSSLADATASSTSASAGSGSASAASAPNECPSASPADSVAAEWEFSGDTGSIAVTGSTDEAEPRIDVTTPFSVSQTEVKTLIAGDGPVVPESATVLVCYMGVNGRDGSTFDSSYERGEPISFPLDGVVAGFQKSIAGQTVGSTVAVAVTSEDGYPNGQPAAGIEAGDTLIFAIKILQSAG